MSDNRAATHASICDLLAAAAARCPDAVAFAAPGRSPLTYGGLYEQVLSGAAALQALGVGPRDRVAVVLPNGPEMAVAFLAASTAAACAPLNPAYRAAEFDFYLSDLRAQSVLVQQGVPSPVREVAANRGLQLIELVPRRDAAAGCLDLVGPPRPAARPAAAPQADDVALLLHTSGTTSRPKLVPLTHGQLCASAHHVGRSLCLTPADRCLNVMPLFHIHGLVAALLATLSAGGSVACTPGFDAAAFFAWLDELEPTWYTAVPTMHQAILAEAPQQREILARRPLRLIRSSSSALPPQVMLGLEDVFHAPVVEAYGMTEAAHQMCCNPLPPGVRKPGSVGLPAGPEVAILDDQGQRVPQGATGEVVIRGPNVMQGYENNAEANATAFALVGIRGLTAPARHPASGGRQPADGLAENWFRTGDLGRFDEDGYLFLAGRIKELINRGGEKISPREVDEVLLDHPAVAQAVTFAVPHVRLDEDVAAAVVLRDGNSATPQQLRDFALARLAAHKVPSQIVVVPEIPKGPTGKPQRIGLHERLAAHLRSEFVAPRDDLEIRVAQIWAEVLRTSTIGVQDNFFALGGDSLLATQVVSRVRAYLDVDLPVSVVFREPTVAALAVLVRESRAATDAAASTPDGSDSRRCGRSPDRDAAPTAGLGSSWRPAVGLDGGVGDPRRTLIVPRGTGAQPAPLSPAQERLWFLDRLHPGSIAFNRPTNLRITGPLDVSVLQQSLDAIVRRHDVLRTVYATVQGQPVQVLTDAPPRLLDMVDLRDQPASAREAESRRLAVEEARRPFDLQRGPVWRARLVRLTEHEQLLLLTIHHIAFDGWSQGILIRELAQTYRALLVGRPPDLPELPLRYADYAAWQREWADGLEAARQVDSWKHHLAGAPAMLDLPTDHGRPPVFRERGARQTFTLPAQVVQRLQAIGQRQGATLFMTLLAAYDVLLCRYTGQEDIVVGSPTAGRTRLESEGLIGLFVNTLLLRVDLSGNPSFLELIDRVREATLAAHAYQDVPLESLLVQLLPQRDLSRSAFFQCMFVLQNVPRSVQDGQEPTFLPAESVDPGIAKFDLTLEVRPTATGWAGFCEYSTDLFEASTITRMIGHWQQLLSAIAAEPAQRIVELPLLTAAERQQLLVDWNDTATQAPPDVCVHELFEGQVARTPDGVAVVFEGQQLTYGELNAQANQLARHLQTLGVGPEILVGLCLERSLDLAVALLAVLKAGGAYVPLDPDYPRERLDFVLADSHPPVVLTETSLADRFSAPDSRVVLLDAERDRLAGLDTANLPCRTTPDNAVYVIYTSGSTGRPKGAINLHRGVSNLLLWENQAWGLTPADRVLLKVPLSFDMSVEEFFTALISGARVVLAKPGGQRDLGYLLQLIIREAVTVTTFVPSVLRAFLEEERVECCHSLRLVSSAGEALTPEVVESFQRRLGAKLDNSYGPTETTVVVTRFPGCPARNGLTVLIGRPGPNIRLYILDEHRNPVPIGVPGELYIGGVAVGRGYLNRPELTAERFVPDVFSNVPGQRLYKTGDRCRYLPDGNIEFLGRLDNQVKIRGNRIELGEIEAVLRGHPAVAQAVVIDREDTPGERYLAAYIVIREGERQSVGERQGVSPPVPDAAALADDLVGERQGVSPPVADAASLVDDLRRRLRTSLPEYMVPQVFEFLPALPQLPNGKLNRKALPKPQRWASSSRRYVAPRTDFEQQLAAIWTEVLSIKEVGIHDNFFDLGGQSLLATRIISRVRDRIGAELSPRCFFEAPTVGQMASRLASAHDGKPGLGPAPVLRLQGSRTAPLSYGQEEIWLSVQLQPDLPVYNEHFSVRIRSVVDAVALEKALNELTGRHEILRTGFVPVEGRPVQDIHDTVSMGLSEIDLRGQAASEREAEACRLATAEARRPFDLVRPPLLRALLARLDESEFLLYLIFHHITIDAFAAYHVLLPELGTLYEAFRAGQPSPLPALPVQYADYCRWQREWMQGPVLQAHLAHWTKQLQDAERTELPTDRPRPASRTFRGAYQPLALSRDLAQALNALSRRESVTLYMTLLAAFKTLLWRYTQQDEIVVGTWEAGRNRPEFEPLVGYFLNTLVLRTEMSGNPTFCQLLQRVREVCLQSLAYPNMPLTKLVEALHLARDPARHVLFQVAFVMEPSLPALESGWTVSQYELQTGTSKFDLTLELEERAEGVIGRLEYNTDLFDSATIERMAGHFQTLLEAIVADPDQRIAQLPLLTERERQRVLVDWNDTATERPNRCMHELFEDQVARTPNAVAIVFEGRQLTYGELNAQANQLARHLQMLGVGPEVLVGLCLERSLELAVALLAVLKAGGAYVPLDSDYPRERLDFVLADCRPPVVLTVTPLADRFSAPGSHLVFLDAEHDRIARLETTNLPCRVTPDNAVYVIYTSGSTGRPKGAINLHRGVCNMLLWECEAWGLGPADRTLLKVPLSFDMSVEEFFAPLIAGARVVLARPGGQRDLGYLVRLIIREEVTVTTFVPSLLRAFLEEEQVGRCRSLRRASSGGETLTPDLVEACQRRLGAELENSYGPTETSVFVTRFEIRQAPDGLTVPIGRPGPNIRLYILDAHRHPVPIGVPGELYIGGVAVGRGYLNRPELTAERFVPDVFSDVAGQHLYRTGDRCRYLPDGNIEFLGRLDNQVKIRGNRIELGEIEAALRGHPAVAQAAVIDREDTPGERYLAAYVVMRGGERQSIGEYRSVGERQGVSPPVADPAGLADDLQSGERRGVSPPVSDPASLVDDLRRRLRVSLPEYMVPQVFEFLPALPQLPNGKLNRKALPQPQRSATPSPPNAAPRTAVEQQLAAIWAEVLGVEQVGIHDNFFERGGHSLSVMRVIARVNRAFQVDVPVRAMFDAPTVAGLAEVVQRAPRSEPPEDEAAEPTAEGLPAGGPPGSEIPADGPVFPVSFAQRRLWFMEQLEGGLAGYNVPFAFRIRGPLDRESLRRALGTIVDRHATLRTTFHVRQGEPVQFVRPGAPFDLPVRELRAGPAEQRAAEVERQAHEEAERPFDLSRDRLLRAALLRLADDDHVLLLTLHHIAADGWSYAVLWRELGSLYAAYRQGDPAQLPELPTQYTDYAVRQREELRGERLRRLAQYWRHQLAGLPPLELPTDHARPPRPTYQGAVVEFDLPDELVGRLRRLSQETGSTLFMTLLAAFQLQLARYAGEHDLALGTPIAGRQQPDLEPLIGCFLNTLVLRTDLSGRPTFRGLLRRVREVALEAYDHQDLPFEQLVEELRPERSLSRGPLIQVLFQVPTFSVWQPELAGLEVTPLPDTSQRTRVDLELYLRRQPTGLRGTLLYSRDLWERASMACLADQYRQLLEQIVDSPDSAIDALSLVTPESREVLPDPRLPLDEPLLEPVTATIADWGRRAPDQAAVRQGSRTWSYRELQDRATAIAHHLLAGVVARGDVVAVYGTPSFGLIASVVGVLAGEAVLLPIDPRLPLARQQLFLDESRARALVWLDGASGTPEDLLGDRPLPVIRVDAATGTVLRLGSGVQNSILAEAGSVAPETPPSAKIEFCTPDPSSPSPDAPAYVFFTSGTTGTPKAVLGCHKGLSHFVHWQRETFAVGPADRVSQLSGLSFDVVLRDVFLPLTSGGTLCLPESPREQPADVWHWLQRDQVTVLHVVPAVLDLWLSEVPDDVSLRSVRWIFLAGEPLTDSLVRRWRERFPDSGQIVNLYGPTETTMVKTYYRVPPGPELTSGVQPVGRPLPNAQALVLDDNLRLCGLGERGQIVIRTPFRTLGYLNDGAGTQARFVQNPFRADPRDLLYLTGDAGRYRPDGVLQILGRLDEQVKIRGVRIEPAEVAATIGGCPGVQSCHVAAWPDLSGQKYLVAYVVPEPGSGITPLELRQHVDRLLPAPMVPAHFVLLDRLPLTPNGKVDRRALPIPDAATAPAGYVAPRTAWEEQLAAIWAEVLNVPCVGIHDHFFHHGGHSLLAVRVMSRISRTLGVELPLRLLFEHPTIADLAECVAAARHGEAGPRSAAIPRIARADSGQFPLSFAQQRLWFLEQLEGNLTAYNMPSAWRLQGPLDVESLRRALETIVHRHEPLRTVFGMQDGAPYQQILPPRAFELPRHDLRGVPAADREAVVLRRAHEEAEKPFDLTLDLALRAQLLQLADEEHVLLLTQHHIASDGSSRQVLWRELKTLYEAYGRSEPSPLPELPCQYVDYAAWQRGRLQGERLQTELDYWQDQLAGLEPLELPTDQPRPPRPSYRGSGQAVRLEAALVRGLRELSRAAGATLQMTLLAAFQVLLHRYSGQEDVAVGVPVAGRLRPELEPLIGFFVNTLVLRGDLSGEPTFGELLTRVRETSLGAYDHQELPFEQLVEALRPERHLSRNPLIQVLFQLLQLPPQPQSLGAVQVARSPDGLSRTHVDLELHLRECGAEVDGRFLYNTDLFEASTIERMVGHYLALLGGIVADPDRSIGELPLLTEAEQQQLLVEWNDTRRDYPRDKCVHQLFEEQAARTSDAIAVICEDQPRTYRELSEQSNQLAHYLRNLGVGSETPVAICVERSAEMVIALLGILKAGGAYVPLDPGHPAQRLKATLQDSAASVVVTQQSLLGGIPVGAARLVCLDLERNRLKQEPRTAPQVRVEPEDLAYVMYTSGSTGQPKGVLITHGSLLNCLRSVGQRPGLSAQDSLLAVSTLAFDIATAELLLPLLVGAKLIVASREEARDARQLQRRLAHSNPTVFQATPATWQMLLDSGWEGDRGLRAWCTGEALSRQLADQLLARTGALWNLYGPTEATIWATVAEVASATRSVSIGRPLTNTRCYVLDVREQLVPIGVPGELYLGGDGLARGYRNRPELTAERFVTSPFEPGARLYRTGDRVRWRCDGTLEFLGRLDDQVKLRGFRIELGEIEAVLRQHSGVTQCVTALREDRPGDKRLVGYYVPGDGNSLSHAELTRHLREQLPDYMVPSAFVPLERLPLTPSGKVDRRALPAPDQDRPELGIGYVPPRDPVEEQLAAIWAEVLGLERIGIHDNFFELGGHSLLAMQVISRVNRACQVDRPVRVVFESPTVAKMAQVVKGLRGSGREPGPARIVRLDREAYRRE